MRSSAMIFPKEGYFTRGYRSAKKDKKRLGFTQRALKRPLWLLEEESYLSVEMYSETASMSASLKEAI